MGNEIAKTTGINLKHIPESVSEKKDWQNKKWPEYTFSYRYTGLLAGVGEFIESVAHDQESNAAITETITVTNLSWIEPLAFGTTDIETEWIAFIDFHIQPRRQAAEVKRRIYEQSNKDKGE